MHARSDEFEGVEARRELAGRHPVLMLFAVMAAGALGVGLRFGLEAAIAGAAGDRFPWSTLLINVGGALAIGVLAATVPGPRDAGWIRPVVGIGLLGGFTTFSTYSLELLELLRAGSVAAAFAYAAAMNLVGLAAAAAGWSAATWLRSVA